MSKGNACVSGQGVQDAVPRTHLVQLRRQSQETEIWSPGLGDNFLRFPFRAAQQCWNNSKVLWHFPSSLLPSLFFFLSFLPFYLSTQKHDTSQTSWTYETFWKMKDSRFHHDLWCFSVSWQPSNYLDCSLACNVLALLFPVCLEPINALAKKKKIKLIILFWTSKDSSFGQTSMEMGLNCVTPS